MGQVKRRKSGVEGADAIKVLRLIWAEMKNLGKNLGRRIDQTNARLDQTNARLEAVRMELDTKIEELRRVMVESHVRLAGAVTDLAGDVRMLTAHLRERKAEDERITACETEVRRLSIRVDTIERSAR